MSTTEPAAPPDAVRRLERRIARERAARVEAESIAERVTSELYEAVQKLTRSTAVLELFGAVASVANEAESPADAMRRCVRLVCENTGWSVGHVYLPDGRHPRVLASSALWHLEGRADRSAFVATTDRTRFAVGQGLPGRVMATRQPAWIADIADDPNFPRAAAAIASGLRAGAAFPVIVEDEVAAVLEFFSPVAAPPDESLLRVMAHVGQQLSRVFERESAESRLIHQALHDDLTGLPNRALLRDRLLHALERAGRADTPVDLLFIDIDDFKTINDSLGHAAGDVALVEVGQRLLSCVRATDTVARASHPTVARLGGDEFAILLEDCARPELVAERILAAVRSPVLFEGGEIFVGGSIGIARHVDCPGGAEELMRAADVAMHVAKRRGKATFERYEPGMAAVVRARHDLGVDLRRATKDGQLFLLYQPEVSLTTGAVVGAEALVRWNHPSRGLVNPDEFIPLAEETGLIVEIGAWVLREACDAATSWTDVDGSRSSLTVAVNVSGRQLRDDAYATVVREALDASGLDPARLCCEITESVLMENPDQAVRTLAAVRATGATIAVDDFGTGYSSLAALKRYPVDYLKVDRSFVRGLPGDEDDAQIVRAVIRLAQNLNLRVIAEGVEDVEQLAALRDYGCDLAQGYLFGRPAPDTDLQALVAASATW